MSPLRNFRSPQFGAVVKILTLPILFSIMIYVSEHSLSRALLALGIFALFSLTLERFLKVSDGER